MSAWHKYSAERSTRAGRSFASKLEAALFDLLVLREKAGEIREISQQAQIVLSQAKIIYKPDFMFVDCKTGRTVFAEAKGYETPEWRIKRRLWLAYGPSPLEVWKGSHRRLTLSETLMPQERSEEMP